jgi:hypothetical protein
MFCYHFGVLRFDPPKKREWQNAPDTFAGGGDPDLWVTPPLQKQEVSAEVQNSVLTLSQTRRQM